MLLKHILFVLLIFKHSNCLEWKDKNVIEVHLDKKLPTLTNSEVYSSKVTLASRSTVTLLMLDIPKSLDFLIVQIHSHKTIVTLSYEERLNIKNHINGTNLGLLVEVKSPKPLYLTNYYKNETVSLYFSVHAYFKNAPVPGGCNMEFNIKDAPFLHIGNDDTMINVEASQARDSINHDCGLQSTNVTHTFYRIFSSEWDVSPDGYFNTLQKMLTVENIIKYGQKIPLKSSNAQLRRLFSLYPGTEAFYVVIAKNQNMSAAYVPIHSYIVNDINSATELLLPILVAMIGLILFSMGFLLFDYQPVIYGPLILFMFIYLWNAFAATAFTSILLFYGIVLSVFIISYATFCFMKILPPALLFLGFMTSCLTFNILPDIYQKYPETFWTIFLCIICMVMVTPFIKHSYYATCSIIGSFCIIIIFDMSIGSYVRYIVINILRRIFVDDFNIANTGLPFQWRDYITLYMWLSLSILGFVLHVKRDKAQVRVVHSDFIVGSEATENTPLLYNIQERDGYRQNWTYGPKP